MTRRRSRRASRRTSRRGRRRALALSVSVLLGALGWFLAPRALARVPLFRVRQIDLVGVKYLAPDAVIAALRLPKDASVFSDERLLADRVKGVHGVADASVERRVPGTLEVTVTEVEPAAFIPATRGGRLVAVDGLGQALPFDPERSGLDLPVVANGDAGVVGVLGLVQAVNPVMFQRITAARSSARGDVVLELGSHRVLLRRDAGPEVIRAVALVAQDLAARGRAYAELDARFARQVVVRRESHGKSGKSVKRDAGGRRA